MSVLLSVTGVITKIYGNSSNVAFVKNCTFVKNTCSESGAAASISSEHFLVTTKAVPPLRFEDW